MTPVPGKANIFSSFLIHLHPRTVPVSTLRFGLSFGLGGMAATLVCVVFISGLLQLLSYSPHPTSAYLSIELLYKSGSIGGFVRNIHFWGGNLLVIVSFLHLLRVFFTGALDHKRRANWLIGICLLTLLLFANFTGYLLPWDQLAYWAVTIFTNMLSYFPVIGDPLALAFRSGDTVGAGTLTIFFGLHVGLVPISLVLLVIMHFWLVRKAGGLIRREEGREERVPAVPQLVAREIATAFVLIASLVTFAALVDAPLAEPANPGQSPNPAKAAWYFMGLQELLLHLHPAVAICFVPALILFAMGLIPFIPGAVLAGGVWFGGQRGRQLVLFTCLGTILISCMVVVLDEQLLHGVDTIAAGDLLLNRGVLPVGVFCIMLLVLYFTVNKLFKFRSAQAVMAIFVVNLSLIITLTVIGIWFRGSGMVLVNPFS